jgi:hypothetical protein
MSEEKIALGQEKHVSFRNLVNLPSTTYGAFGLYRYPAKFIPHVVAFILEKYAKSGMSIFDPFAGYGTVGTVSRLYGCNYEMWDLNPIIETLHSITLLEPLDIDISKTIESLKSSNEVFLPKWSRFDYWFADEFVNVLTKAWGYYHSIESPETRLLLTIPLLKVSRYFSFDDMGRMKLSSSPKSKKRVKKLLEDDWKSIFYRMLSSEIELILKRLKEYQTLTPKRTKALVRGGIDTFSTKLAAEKDILITSPPYLQSQEYIRQAKMDLYWLGYDDREIQRLSKLEIPYRAVEAMEIISPTFLSIRMNIEEDHIRRIYDQYFHAVVGSLTHFQEKVNSYLMLFVGRSSMRGQPVPIDRILAEHFTAMGWTHEITLIDTIVARRMFSYRKNPATDIEDDRTSSEYLVILRRP